MVNLKTFSRHTDTKISVTCGVNLHCGFPENFFNGDQTVQASTKDYIWPVHIVKDT